LSIGAYPEAKGPALLLIANIVSVNLTVQLTMQFKGIKPREEDQHFTALVIFIAGILLWCALIAYLVYRLNT
jgi:uncharacterized membrane protein